MGTPDNDTYSFTYIRAYPLPRLNDFENKRINYVVLHVPRFEVYNIYHHFLDKVTLFSEYIECSETIYTISFIHAIENRFFK